MNYEDAAKRYCEIRGLNPMETGLVPCPDGKPGCCVAHFGPAYLRYIEQAKDIDAWYRALELKSSGPRDT